MIYKVFNKELKTIPFNKILKYEIIRELTIFISFIKLRF